MKFLTARVSTLFTLSALWIAFVAAGSLAQSTPTPASVTSVRKDKPAVALTESPVNLRVYPRDDEGLGHVVYAGVVNAKGVSSVRVEVTRDDEAFEVKSQNLEYAESGSAKFSITIPIKAELSDYDFKASMVTEDGSTVFSTAENVAAGDVFLIQGQSNAVATDYHNERLANESQHPWIRSFGTASTDGNLVRNDLEWHIADGLGANGQGTVGAWGLRMARNLVDQYRVPIGLLNGAVGGTRVSYHQRNDSDPYNLNTNYGRLLYRCEQAGVRNMAKAILWYQGESDGTTPPNEYVRLLRALYEDWREDYRGVRHLYIFQVREGCGGPTLEIREVHRRIADGWQGTEVMSTNGAPAHDGCHFRYEGYRTLGDWITRLVARDLFGATNQKHIEAPNPRRAEFTSEAKDEILIRLRDTEDELTWNDGAHAHFTLHGGGDETIVGGESAGAGAILLQLSGPSTATGVSYGGHAGDGPWITNSRGIGLLTFYSIPIQP